MKIVVVASAARSLLNFRGTLLASLRSAGHTIVACATGADPNIVAGLQALNVTYHEVPLERRGRHPIGDARYCLALRRMLASEDPDVLFAYTMKPVVYASLAAMGRRPIARYSLISGMGYAFEDGAPHGTTGTVLRTLLRLALRGNAGIIFQNPDDHDLFHRLGLVRGARTLVVRGSGVQLDRFPAAPISSGSPRFLLLARMIRAKGVELFVHAARRIKEKHPSARFVMAGGIERGPDALTAGVLEAWHRSGEIEYLGRLADVRDELARCTAYVLPSYYREGTPRSVLEAMSTGRAIVTTDAPGCRETVFEAAAPGPDEVRVGLNGMLIPPRSIEALVAALQRFIDDPELGVRLGGESRRLAEAHYDARAVDRHIMDFMGLGRST